MIHAVWTLWLGIALAAPTGFDLVGKGAGCQFYRAPVEEDGNQAARAECHWPEVPPERLAAWLGRFERYDELIPPVVRSEIVRVDGERSLVHQVARTRGLAPRQVLIWMQSRSSDASTRVGWTTATGEPLALAPRHHRALRNEGWWEVSAHPDGGAQVVHQVLYDPGGAVPAWVVRWAQVGGLREVMQNVRDVAAHPGPTP